MNAVGAIVPQTGTMFRLGEPKVGAPTLPNSEAVSVGTASCMQASNTPVSPSPQPSPALIGEEHLAATIVPGCECEITDY